MIIRLRRFHEPSLAIPSDLLQGVRGSLVVTESAMARNVSGRDAWLRTTCAVGLVGVAGIFYEQSSFVAITLIAACMLGITALWGRCPLYAALGIQTCGEEEASEN